MADEIVIGRVAELNRYPVKSMLGEALEVAAVDKRGFRGDRVTAFLDVATGKVASAKLPHRWRKLLSCSAVYDEVEAVAVIVMPDGTRLHPDDAAAPLSALLEREVRPLYARPDALELDRVGLEEVASAGSTSAAVSSTVLQIGFGAPEGGFFDAMPVHFLTTSSLQALAEHTSRSGAAPARFRPNIVIESTGAPFAENDWGGSTLRFGDDLALAVICPTPRCAVPTLAHGVIPEDRALPKALAALNRAQVLHLGEMTCLGAYGSVSSTGLIRIGDTVSLYRP